MVPGLWLNEGGQSAAGAAIDHLVRMHPAAEQAASTAHEHGVSLSHWLSMKVEERGGAAATEGLVGGIHVVPEFLGNRAPFADPDARGLIAGLGMETDFDSLLGLYLAGVCGLGYGARQIVRSLHEKNVPIDTIVVSGGAGQSPLVRQLLADATGMVVAASTSQEPVLLGSAILGAVAAGHHKDTVTAMAAMSELGELYRPTVESGGWHARRFAAFELLQRTGRSIRDGQL
jgi:D-ribulokinase